MASGDAPSEEEDEDPSGILAPSALVASVASTRSLRSSTPDKEEDKGRRIAPKYGTGLRRHILSLIRSILRFM